MNSNDYNSLHEHNDTYDYSELGEEYIGALRGGCISAIGLAVTIGVVILTLFLFTGCKHVEYVSVPEVRTEHHWHTDTLERVDSVIDHQQTIIREVDSAMMAQFGIQLKKAERAWLIQNDRLQREIDHLRQVTQQADTIRDTIPVPYPVEKRVEVEKPLSLFTKILIVIGWLTLMAFVIWCAVKLKKYLP